MKQTFLLLFCLACSIQLFAQEKLSADNEKARTSTERLTTMYDLDANQSAKVYSIQVRKQKQLEQIQSLETSNPELYITKLKALHEGNEGSIKLLLNQEQLRSYQRNFLRVREERAAKAKALKEQGASNLEIEKAILAIEQ